jgi:hypothetical protein
MQGFILASIQVAENANKKHSAEKHQNNCNSESKANVTGTSTLKLPKFFGSKAARDKHQFEMLVEKIVNILLN